MSEILLFWFGLVIVFIIVELFTTTFYGFALALASAVTGLYVYFMGDLVFEIIHGVIFVIASAILAYFLPRYLVSSTPDMPQGSDRYIGEKRVAKKSGGDLKISLDGVEYLIDSADEIASGDKVEIIGHKGASMKVKKVHLTK